MDKLSSIVVGIDYTGCSETALAQGIRIGGWNRAKVHPVHVIDMLSLVELEMAFSPLAVTVQQGLIEDAKAAWKDFGAGIAGKGPLSLDVLTDNPYSALSASVERYKADLLVLGMNGAAGHKGVGSVATRCVRHAPCRVLLTQAGQTGPFRTVVACVDFSETSREALQQAERIAAQDGSSLHVVHVFRPPWTSFGFRTRRLDDSPTTQAKFREFLRTRLEEFCRPKDPQTVWSKPRFEVVDDTNHGEGIARYVRTCGADLVVLGTRGKTNLRDVVLGSTAERVVREAPCSILAIKPGT